MAAAVAASVLLSGCIMTNAMDSLGTAGGALEPGTVPAAFQTRACRPDRSAD